VKRDRRQQDDYSDGPRKGQKRIKVRADDELDDELLDRYGSTAFSRDITDARRRR